MNSKTCGICKVGEDEVDFETRCKHHFHKICLEIWFDDGKKTCPCCNNELSNTEAIEKVLKEQNYDYIPSLFDSEKKDIFSLSIAEKKMELFNAFVEYL